MKTKRLLLIAFLVFLMTGSVGFAADFTRIFCQVDGKIGAVVAEDLNGDNINDLLVTYAKGNRPNAKPRVAVFYAQSGGFANAPDFTVDLPEDTCLVDLADLDADGKQELILIRKQRVQSFALAPGGAGQWKTLASRGSSLMFPSQDGLVPYLDLLRDWTGDGRPELAIPDYARLSFFHLNGKGEFVESGRVKMRVKGWMSVMSPESDFATGIGMRSGMEMPDLYTVK